jgi:hypothetical protein
VLEEKVTSTRKVRGGGGRERGGEGGGEGRKNTKTFSISAIFK